MDSSSQTSIEGLNIAVCIPVLNEAQTIQKVVSDFGRYIPGCKVYVIDNLSTDRSPALAEEAGATVLLEKRRGKGQGILFKRNGRGPWIASRYDHSDERRERSTRPTERPAEAPY